MAVKKKRRDYDGRPSVTTIIGQTLGWSKDALIGWAYKLGKEGRSLRERDDAATLGSCVHYLVAKEFGAEETDEEYEPAVIEAATPNAARVVEWIKERYEVVACERAIVGEDYAGTLDYVLRDKQDGALLVADLKTGKGVYDEVAVQLGAYAKLWANTTNDQGISGGLVIHAHPGEPLVGYAVTDQQVETGAEVFRQLLAIYSARGLLRVKP